MKHEARVCYLPICAGYAPLRLFTPIDPASLCPPLERRDLRLPPAASQGAVLEFAAG